MTSAPWAAPSAPPAPSTTAGRWAGYSTTQDGSVHAFLSGPNGVGLHDLGVPPGATNSYGYGVNAGGQVTGYITTAPGSAGFHAFLSDPNGGAIHDLGTLSGGSSQGYGVNDSGQVAGVSDSFAFLSDPNGGALHNLGALGGTASEALAINNSGTVVGDYTPAGGSSRAFVFSDGVMRDLTSLIFNPHFTMEAAYGISNNGDIVVTGKHGNDFGVFLLTPAVPEASSVVFSGPAVDAGPGQPCHCPAQARQRLESFVTTPRP